MTRRRNPEKVARADGWCAEYHGEPSVRKRYTNFELAALKRRCGLEGDMSFGEGNLHEKVDRLKDVNGKLCAEINRQERRIRELEELVRYMEPWTDGAARGLVVKRMEALGIEVAQ